MSDRQLTELFAKDFDSSGENILIISDLKNNSRIMSLNPTIYSRLISSDEVFPDSFSRYLRLLEVVDFERVYLSLKFLIDVTADEVKYVGGKSHFFPNYENMTFWLDYEPSSLKRDISAINEKIISLLKNAFRASKIKIDLISNVLFYRDKEIVDGQERLFMNILENFRFEDLCEFLLTILTPYLRHQYAEMILKNVTKSIISDGSDSDVIQFLDCYVENGEVKSGFYSSVSRFIIRREVFKCIENSKPTKVVKEVDQLIEHLCDYDSQTVEVVESILASVFLNSQKFKNALAPHLRIYGPSGGNGKTTLENLLNLVFGYHNVFETKLSKLDDYQILDKTVKSLIAIDGDASSTTISSDSAENFKKLVTGDSISSRQIYGSYVSRRSMCLLIAFSNNLPKTSDKSDAFARRMNIVKCSSRLKDAKFKVDQEWFRKIRSDDAAQYLIEKLLLIAVKMSKDEIASLPARSKPMIDLLESYTEENDSAVSFVREIGIDKIVGMQVKEIRDEYERWCEENDRSILKKQFNDTLQDKFGLIRKRVPSKFVNKDSMYYARSVQTKEYVNVWQFEDADKNDAFFRNQI